MRETQVVQPECGVCGDRSARRMWTLRFEAHPGPFPLWQCHNCGVVFNWPRLSSDGIREQYDGDYYIFNLPAGRRWARATQLYVEHLLPLEGRAGRRLLEIGCGRGDLLALARRRGWETQGVEISAAAGQCAREEHGLRIHNGTLEACGEALGPFDVAVTIDVIEHVPSPGPFLTAVRAALAPGGRAIIETPNYGGLWRRLGGARWLGINRFHLFLFDAPGLVGLMRACGFRQCRAFSSTHTAHVEWGWRPELAGVIGRLPAPLRWRAQRGLNRATPDGPRLDLWRRPPTSFEEALARIDRVRTSGEDCRPTRGLSGDNLIVVGRAWSE